MPSVPIAVDRNGTEFTAVDCARLGDRFADTYPPLRPTQGYACADEDCRTDVVYVSGHAYRPARGVEGRRAYLRLRSREQDHAPGCKYRFDALAGAIVEIFADEVERNGDHFVLALRPQVPEGGQRARTAPADAVGDAQRIEVYTRVNNPKLRKTIQAAAHVIDLLDRFGNDEALMGRFRASWAGHTIRWPRFFFDLTTDGEVERLGRYLARRRVDHPIAVLSYVAYDADESVDGRSWALRISEAGEQAVRVRSYRYADVDYVAGTCLLIYGDWSTWGAEIQLWINDRNGGIAEMPD